MMTLSYNFVTAANGDLTQRCFRNIAANCYWPEVLQIATRKLNIGTSLYFKLRQILFKEQVERRLMKPYVSLPRIKEKYRE